MSWNRATSAGSESLPPCQAAELLRRHPETLMEFLSSFPNVAVIPAPGPIEDPQTTSNAFLFWSSSSRLNRMEATIIPRAIGILIGWVVAHCGEERKHMLQESNFGQTNAFQSKAWAESVNDSLLVRHLVLSSPSPTVACAPKSRSLVWLLLCWFVFRRCWNTARQLHCPQQASVEEMVQDGSKTPELWNTLLYTQYMRTVLIVGKPN